MTLTKRERQTEAVQWAVKLEKFYREIPDNEWGTRRLISQDGTACCAMGHLQAVKQHGIFFERIPIPNSFRSVRIKALQSIMALTATSIAAINDGENMRYQQPTPRERIIAFLQDVQQGKVWD